MKEKYDTKQRKERKEREREMSSNVLLQQNFPKSLFPQIPFCKFPIFLAKLPCFLPDFWGRGLFGLCLLHTDNPFSSLFSTHPSLSLLIKIPSLSSFLPSFIYTYIYFNLVKVGSFCLLLLI